MKAKAKPGNSGVDPAAAIKSKVDAKIMQLLASEPRSKKELRKLIKLTPNQKHHLGSSIYIIVHNAFLRLTRAGKVYFDKKLKLWYPVATTQVPYEIQSHNK